MRRNSALIGILVVASLAVITFGVLQLAPGAGAPVTGGSQQASAGPTPSTSEVRRISVGDLHTQLQGSNPPLVWDLRSTENYAQQHIPGAQLVQMTEIPTLAQGLDRKQAMITLCA